MAYNHSKRLLPPGYAAIVLDEHLRFKPLGVRFTYTFAP